MNTENFRNFNLHISQLGNKPCLGARSLSWCASLGQHREGGSILSGSIGSTPEIELLSPIPARRVSGREWGKLHLIFDLEQKNY